ncbi:type II secretion system protein N [Pseudomonas cerasi]
MLVKGFIKDGYLKKNWKALVMTLISIAMIPASVLIIAEYNMKKKALVSDEPIHRAENKLAAGDPPLERLGQLTFFFRPQEKKADDYENTPSDMNDHMFNAPISGLNFHVTGIINTSRQQHSLAIVRQGQKQYSLLVGEKLPNTNAEIVHIFIDRIIINCSGKYESLRMNN